MPKDTENSNSIATFWIAEYPGGGQTVQAFGTTPEDAAQALVKVWIALTKSEGLDQERLYTFRDSITVSKAEIGKGYAIAGTDSLWYEEMIGGDDPKISQILAQVTPNSAPKI